MEMMTDPWAPDILSGIAEVAPPEVTLTFGVLDKVTDFEVAY